MLNKKFYKTIEPFMTDVFWIISKQLKHLWISESTIKLTGYTPEESKKIPIDKKYPEKTIMLILNMIEEIKKDIEKDPSLKTITKELVIEIFNKNGDVLTCQSICQAIIRKGKILYYKGLTRDITVISKTKTLQGVIEMAGATCHEFSQPTQALVGYVTLLEETWDTKYIQKIKEQSERISEILSKTQHILHSRKYKSKMYISDTNIVDLE